jgi:hypothetical protein
MSGNQNNMWGNVQSIFSTAKKAESISKLYGLPLFDNKNTFEGEDDIEAGDSTSMLHKISKGVKQQIEVETSYKTFLITLAIGVGFLLGSSVFLPFVIISPYKFILLFSIGSLITLFSFIFIYGTTEFVKKLFEKERIVFTICYLVGLVVGLYNAYQGNYLYSIICAGVQLVTLIIFVLTFIPGGKSGINLILAAIKQPFIMIWDRIRGRN